MTLCWMVSVFVVAHGKTSTTGIKFNRLPLRMPARMIKMIKVIKEKMWLNWVAGDWELQAGVGQLHFTFFGKIADQLPSLFSKLLPDKKTPCHNCQVRIPKGEQPFLLPGGHNRVV